jgi:hypothetical protein
MPLKRARRAATVFEFANTRRALGQADPVDLGDHLAEPAVLGRRGQIAVFRAELVVRLPVLVDQPHDLVRVPDRVAREARGDHRIHGSAAGVAQVEAAPRGGAPHEVETLALDERHRDEVGVHAPRAQLVGEPPDVELRAAPRERALDAEDEHPARLQRVSGTRPGDPEGASPAPASGTRPITA